ncbi:MAG: hypothetical protein GX335_09235 [Firmicutes bacterium]|nr:hypothetical protein [Bacillota bacterium]
MQKRIKGLLIITLAALVFGTSLVWAQESQEQFLPWRTRVLEILGRNPEILEELKALREEFDGPDFEGQEERVFWGRMGAMMMGRGPRRGRGHCRRFFSSLEEFPAYGHHWGGRFR